jgi:predicted ArsR family transcriptional regulator
MNLLAQLTAAAQPPRLDKRTVRAERIVPGSSSEQILALMADGRVWSSIAVADHLKMPRTTARSAMDRLVRFGHLDCVGRVESDRGGRTPLKIYRKRG